MGVGRDADYSADCSRTEPFTVRMRSVPPPSPRRPSKRWRRSSVSVIGRSLRIEPFAVRIETSVSKDRKTRQ